MATELLEIQLFSGRTFCNPGTGIQTEFYAGGGLSPGGIWMPFNVDDNGNLLIQTGIPDTTVSVAHLSAIPASVTSVDVLPLNMMRKGLILVNNSNATCYVAFQDVASQILYTLDLEPGSTWNMDPPIYTGVISAIWTSANGQLQVTEF